MPRAASDRPPARSRRIEVGRGMVLSGCRPEAAASWARRGLAPLVVAGLDGWTVVMPAGRPAARPPYDDAVRLLAGRPVGLRMRPALGFFQIGRQAVITVHPGRWRAVQRWAVWTPREAHVGLPHLPSARPADIVAAAGPFASADALVVENAVRDILRDGSRDAMTVLAALLEVLGLPGFDVLSGATDVHDLPGADTVVPRSRHARTFDRLVAEETRYREELET